MQLPMSKMFDVWAGNRTEVLQGFPIRKRTLTTSHSFIFLHDVTLFCVYLGMCHLVGIGCCVEENAFIQRFSLYCLDIKSIKTSEFVIGVYYFTSKLLF